MALSPPRRRLAWTPPPVYALTVLLVHAVMSTPANISTFLDHYLRGPEIFDRTVVAIGGVTLKAKSFVLPAVVPGSVIEYR